MSDITTNKERSLDLQQRWHGWGSPVGLGLGIMFLFFGLAAITAASSLVM